MMRVEALEDAGQLSSEEKIRLLEESVRRSPNWVNNRERLAWAYEGAGMLSEVLQQVRAAISNLEDFKIPEKTEPRIFEELITGRAEPHLQEDLNKHVLDLAARLAER